MGTNDLDPRTIDLNLNVNLAIQKLYQYEYVAQVHTLLPASKTTVHV